VLELYQEILGRLPSHPEIHTATSGARAIALLQSEPFTLLISDLNMPKMDGLQVLTIVRRRFPEIRTAVLTSVADEQFRTRAYAMGIDLFLEKPTSTQEIRFVLDCIESLLGQDDQPGFRGVQSKSLVDIVQLECLSHSSSVLHITQGPLEGRIWIRNGDIIDAATTGLTGEAAFRKILSWRTGSFQLLPEDGSRTRAISSSYQGLLLETAQALDETASAPDGTPAAAGDVSGLARFGEHSGVEFALVVPGQKEDSGDSWGVENAEALSTWIRQTISGLEALGDTLQAGHLNRVEANGPHRHICLARHGDDTLCVGFNRSLPLENARETMKQIICQWLS
jgi:CheY-like chemotaxis protein